MKLAVPDGAATVSPLQRVTLQQGPRQGPGDAAPITNAAPHPSSQRPYSASCAAVRHTVEGCCTSRLSFRQWC